MLTLEINTLIARLKHATTTTILSSPELPSIVISIHYEIDYEIDCEVLLRDILTTGVAWRPYSIGSKQKDV